MHLVPGRLRQDERGILMYRGDRRKGAILLVAGLITGVLAAMVGAGLDG